MHKSPDELVYQRALKTYGLEGLRRLVQEGIDSGPSVPAAKVFERLIAKYEAMAKAQWKSLNPKR